MKVFKFGGASVNSVDRIQNLARIMQSYRTGRTMVIISAMGKTTNALEKVADAFFTGNKEEALHLFDQVKQQHLATAGDLLGRRYPVCAAPLQDFFTEVEWLLHDQPVREYDYYYDQIVCAGELLSTAIISAYLNETGVTNTWLDVRDIFRTDDDFRDAGIDWDFTLTNVKERVLPVFEKTPVINIVLVNEKKVVTILVSDNGVGLPVGFDWEHTDSLGLKLVNFWVKYQLAGSINVSIESGTKYSISFNYED